MNGGIVSHAPLPLVSAIIPAYNCAKFLDRAIRSVLCQTWTNIECIVVDDGSSDETPAIIRSFGDRVRSVRQPNRGASAARNAGLALAQGDYVAFLDADDYWLDTKTANQLAVFQSHLNLALIWCNFKWIDFDSPLLDDNFKGPARQASTENIFNDLAELLADPYLGTPSVMVKADVLKRIGGFDTSLRIGEDVDMYFRLCKDAAYARVNQVLVHFQHRPDSLTKQLSGYRDNLRVLDRLEDTLPNLAQKHPDLFRRHRQAIYTSWTKDLLFRGRGREARTILREAHSGSGIAHYHRLMMKSVIAPWLAAARERINLGQQQPTYITRE